MVILLRHPTDRVVVNRPSPREPEGRVLPFRPRGALFARPVPRPPAVPDLEKYERAPDEPDDFRHRMLMNGLGLDGASVTFMNVGVGGSICSMVSCWTTSTISVGRGASRSWAITAIWRARSRDSCTPGRYLACYPSGHP